MKTRFLSLVPVALAMVQAAPAHASGWTLPKGTGQVIVTGVYSHSDKGYDVNGNIVDIPDYDKQELYVLAEYGLTDDVTILVNPSFRHVGVEGDNENTTGFGYTELGARYRFARGDNWVASVQGSARIPGERRRDILAQVGSTDPEYDVRGLVGSSFKLAGMDAFIDAQAGYRFREGDPPNEYRGDVTLGLRPTQPLLIYGQVFNVVSDGAGEGVFQRYRYHNAYLNAAYDLDEHWSVQVGGLATLGGENALRERGLTAGVWFRF